MNTAGDDRVVMDITPPILYQSHIIVLQLASDVCVDHVKDLVEQWSRQGLYVMVENIRV